jgi:DNA-binding CsgD family transcriptional regulator
MKPFDAVGRQIVRVDGPHFLEIFAAHVRAVRAEIGHSDAEPHGGVRSRVLVDQERQRHLEAPLAEQAQHASDVAGAVESDDRNLEPVQLAVRALGAPRQVRGPRAGGMAIAATTGDPAHDPLRDAAHLTRRQRQVLALTAAGNTSKKTAEALGITADTVNTHIKRMMTFAGITRRAALICLRPPSSAR